MKKLGTIIVGGLLVVGAAALLWPSADETASSAKTWAMSWAPKTVYRYHLDYASTQDVSPFAGTNVDEKTASSHITSNMRYVGELHWRLLNHDKDGTWQLGLKLANCESVDVRVSENDILPEHDSCKTLLEPWELVVELDANGRIEQIREPSEAPEVFGYLAAFLASEVAVTWPSAGTEDWQENEVDMLGTVASVYDVVAQESPLLRVERKRSKYLALDATALMNKAWLSRVNGKHKIRFHSEGYVEDLMGAQTVVAADEEKKPFLKSTSRLHLRFVDQSPDRSGQLQLAQYSARAVKEARNDGKSRDRMLVDRVDGLTREEALSTLTRFAKAGKLPDHNRFLWRMVALLRLEPDLAEDLKPVFLTGNTVARKLVLDLLASAGTPEAQTVMRELIESKEGQSDPDDYLLSQRLGLLKEPTQETIDFARRRYVESATPETANDHYSAAYTLGAIAKNADEETGAELRGLLATELSAANDPMVISHFIKAIGNARSEDDASRLASYANHEDSDVRLAAANNLGRPATPAGYTALMTLVADADRGVQKQAIRSLRHYDLQDPDFETLAQIVDGGALHHTNQRAMLELTKMFRQKLPAGTTILLEALIRSGIKDNQVQAAAHRLMTWGPKP